MPSPTIHHRQGSPSSLRTGVVEWVLLPDGWCSLTPVIRDGWEMVRLQRVGPRDLPRALARLAAGLAA